MGEIPEQINLEVTKLKNPLEPEGDSKNKKDEKNKEMFENFIKELQNPDLKKVEDISEVFDDYGKDIINSIKENFETKDKLDENQVKILSEAIKAFETDIKQLNPDGKNRKLNKLSQEIEALKSSAVIKNNKINFNLNRNRTPAMLESEFFKGGSESDFNDTFDYLFNMGIATDIFSTEDGKKFENMIKTYLGSKAESIKIKKAEKTDPDYSEGTRIITYTEGGQEKKLARGNREKEQERKSDKFAENIPDEIFGTDKKGLNTFDGNGNHEAFKKFLEKKGTTYITSNLDNIINGIKDYKTEQPGNTTEIQNGYANVLNDYIAQGDEGLMRSYLNEITTSNLFILGLDKKTQGNNFDKIVESKTFKRIQESLDEATSKELLNVKLTIETEIKDNSADKVAENIKNMGEKTFDKILQAFGGVILSIIELFGGKGLLKKFCSRFNIDNKYFSEIENLYNDKYRLKDEQLNILKEINGDKNETDNRSKDGKDIMSDRQGKEIKYNKENIKSTYINKLSSDSNLKDFLRLDPALIQKGLIATNIEQKANIVITKLSNDGKTKIQEINPDIEKLTTGPQRAEILKNIMTDDVREEIQEAGNKISRSNRVYNSALEKNEGMDDYEIDKLNKDNAEAEKMQEAKGLKNATDIGMYLGVYLMKGSGDLKYSVSQTEGVPSETIRTRKTTNENIKLDYINADGTLKGVDNKSINDIFNDYDNAPYDLLFTPKGEKENKKIIKGIIDGEITYVYEAEKSKKVEIQNGDKIEADPDKIGAADEMKEKLKKIVQPDDGNYDFTGNTNSDEEKKYIEEYLKPFSDVFIGTTIHNGKVFQNYELFIDKELKKSIESRDFNHLKNTFLLIKKSNTDKINLDPADFLTTKIDAKKQTYNLTKTRDKHLIIEAREGGNLKGNINISQDNNKLIVRREEKNNPL